ncbi:MAG TPA: hypothetical protein VGB22_01040 [candidate division Zixibacteria bacterium]|jgi:hypothetical protein
MRKLAAILYLVMTAIPTVGNADNGSLPREEVTVQLGAALPSSDLLKKSAETGVYFGGSYQHYLTPRLTVGLQGGWNKFGTVAAADTPRRHL